MELRSGSLIASATGFTSAEQARAACMGQARVQLSPQHRPAFDSAVRGVMLRWTALRLAVENQWGGEGSDARAAELEQSILGWFYAKGALRVHCSCVRASATGRAKARPCGGALTTAAARFSLFYTGDHYADELEEHLDEYLVEDFHVECEDGSTSEARRRWSCVYVQCRDASR